MEELKNWLVYEHIFPNGKRYIGITSQQPERRWRKDGKGYSRQPIIFNAIIKYGWDNIIHNIITTNLSHEEACKIERELIAKYRTNEKSYGYNYNAGGDQTTKYTDRQLQEIYTLWKNGASDEIIAQTMDTTPSAILGIRNKRGWVGLNYWSQEDKNFLLEYYANINNIILGYALNKTPKSISRMADRLNLHKIASCSKPLCSFERKTGKILAIFSNKYEASNALNISPSYVAHKIARKNDDIGLRYLTKDEEKNWAQSLYLDFIQQ